MARFKLLGKIAIFTLTFFVLFYYPFQALAVGLFPNDPELERQYYLEQIKALEAWNTIKQTPEIAVAVIDSGIDIEHPDLADNIWHNPGEIPGDGIDNDNNGYIDDVSGWDFILNSPDPRPKFAGKFSKLGINHGTIVAGVIGAVGNNNFGLSGVTWHIKIMPLRVMDGEGTGETTSVYRAIKYAINKGADIINLSMVGSVFDPKLDEVIAEAYQQGIVIVAAAGNETNSSYLSTDFSLNLELHPQYPVCHNGGLGHNYVLGVGSVDYNDHKSRFSNYGSKCVDLMAPGESFFGTLFFAPTMLDFNKYFGGYWSGSSLAAPQVTAAAALVKTLRPDLGNGEIYNLLINNADNIDEQNPSYRGLLGGGRLNLAKVISAANNLPHKGLDIIVAAAGQSAPQVKIFNQSGQERFNFLAYDKKFTGGVSLAAADINSDGAKEIITAAGAGGGPHLRIFNGSGEVLGQFFAYDKSFSGGVNLAVGDVDGDGKLEIITSPQGKLKPLVRIFDAAGKLKGEFLAFANNFFGGVNLTLSDINADGQKEIVAAPGRGTLPQIKIFNQQGQLIEQFLAYDKSFTGGVKVAAANLYGDMRTEIVTAPAGNFKPQVRLFSPNGDLDFQWLAAEANYLGGLNLAIGNVDGDSQPEVIISQKVSSKPQVKIFSLEGEFKKELLPFKEDFQGGLNLTVK